MGFSSHAVTMRDQHRPAAPDHHDHQTDRPHDPGTDHPHLHPDQHDDGTGHPHPHPDPHDHGTGHPHPHPHHHDHGTCHPHPHPHPHRHDHFGAWARIRHMLGAHSHDNGTDSALESSAEGLRTLWISLAALAATACGQAVVVALSGSIALLGDALHNGADALTAVPLGIAFALGRRRPNRRYTYGYGRAEGPAGGALGPV